MWEACFLHVYFLQSAGKLLTKCKCGPTVSRLFSFTCNVQEICFLQKCRKVSAKCFIDTNLNTTVSVVNMCRKISYTRVAQWCTSAGRFPTHELHSGTQVQKDFLHTSCKMVHKCRSTYFKNLEFLVKCGKHPNTGTLRLFSYYHISIASLSSPAFVAYYN